MINSNLNDVEKAIDIYYGYIKLAQTSQEQFKPFASLLAAFGLPTFIFLKHMPLLRKMNEAISFDSFYNLTEKEEKEKPYYIVHPYKEWLTTCKNKNIITLEEYEMLSDLLKRISNRDIDREEWQSALGDVEASEFYSIIVKET